MWQPSAEEQTFERGYCWTWVEIQKNLWNRGKYSGRVIRVKGANYSVGRARWDRWTVTILSRQPQEDKKVKYGFGKGV